MEQEVDENAAKEEQLYSQGAQQWAASLNAGHATYLEAYRVQ